MRKVLISIAAASAAFVAVPAAAQGYYGQGYYDQGHYGQGYGQPHYGQHGIVQSFDSRIAQLRHRIERSAERGAITRREYRSLRERADDLRRRLHAYSRDGLSRGEARDISQRIDNLRERLRDERQDGRRGRDRYDD
jgi:hypothetical protein